MTKTQDFTKVFQDMMAAFLMDTAKFQEGFKSQAALGEKFSKVALEAAEKSTELSSKWAKDTIAKLGTLTASKEDAAEITKAINDFASASAESAAENLAAFAEIAKKVQMETVDLMLAAGKEASDEASAVVKKATETAKKATAAK